jgi:hypothetical protein
MNNNEVAKPMSENKDFLQKQLLADVDRLVEGIADWLDKYAPYIAAQSFSRIEIED